MRMTDKQKERIAVIRIIACAAVFLIHYGQHNGEVIPQWFHEIINYGQDGLWIFYILSGMLAFYSYSLKKSGGVKQYYIGRILRICPAAYFWLLIIYIIYAVIYAIPSFRSAYMYVHTPLDWQWLISVFFLNSIIPTSDYAMWNGMNILGTLGNFMVFYLLVPILFKYICNLRRAVVFFLGCCVIHFPGAIVYRNLLLALGNKNFGTWPQTHFFVCVCWYFALGMIMYHVQQNNYWKEMLICLIVAFLACVRYKFLADFYIGIFIAMIISAFMTIGVSKPVGVNITSKIERYSFPLFLCHVVIFHCVNAMQRIAGFSLEIKALLEIVFPIIAAILTYHLICRPFDKIRYKIAVREVGM